MRQPTVLHDEAHALVNLNWTDGLSGALLSFIEPFLQITISILGSAPIRRVVSFIFPGMPKITRTRRKVA